MKKHPLDVYISVPLEREYEAWIIRGIEDYFQSLGERIDVWAVTPKEEVVWPADEGLFIGRKLIGLQMKKVLYAPTASSGLRDFSRLNWTFHQPAHQFPLVLNCPEIFYCLPTFINRNVKEQALSHCIFWRPFGDSGHRTGWYDNNKKAQTNYKNLGSERRWGKFLEDILSCKLGIPIGSVQDAKDYIGRLRGYMRELPFREELYKPEQEKEPDIRELDRMSVYVLSLPNYLK